MSAAAHALTPSLLGMASALDGQHESSRTVAFELLEAGREA